MASERDHSGRAAGDFDARRTMTTTETAATTGRKTARRADDEAELDFWRSLARAGPNAVSEGLSDDDYARLHLAMPLEDHLLEQARKGRSIVLTGNAGDGKTHLARTLQRRLGDDAARFVFEYDATAVMTSQDGVAPIVDTWRQAANDGKGMVLAINQYPLHMLRPKLRSALPGRLRGDRTAVAARACRSTPSGRVFRSRGPPARGPVAAQSPLAAIRETGAKQDAGEPGRAAPRRESHADPNFSLNFRCLSHAEVQTRLFDLFRRVVSAGGRATIRELWILCARLLFGTASDVDIPGSHRAWYSDRLFEPDLAVSADRGAVPHRRPGGSEPPADRPAPGGFARHSGRRLAHRRRAAGPSSLPRQPPSQLPPATTENATGPGSQPASAASISNMSTAANSASSRSTTEPTPGSTGCCRPTPMTPNIGAT